MLQDIKIDSPPRPLKVVSVSLGSSKRNKKSTATFMGKEVHFERIGTDADFKKAARLIKELDGKVDAIGLGGVNLFIKFNDIKYHLRDAVKLAKMARLTPVVDGYGLKKTMEKSAIKYLQDNNIVDFIGKKVLMVCALDRIDMADTLYYMDLDIRYGDLAFGLGIPYTFSKSNNLDFLNTLASFILPIIGILPYSVFYPLGKKQEKSTGKFSYLLDNADIIVGDFHYIRQNLPDRLDNKVIITSTTTAEDLGLLKSKGLNTLIRTTPVFDGRSFGTNMMEAVVIALAGKRPEEMSDEDYYCYINELNWYPDVLKLN